TSRREQPPRGLGRIELRIGVDRPRRLQQLRPPPRRRRVEQPFRAAEPPARDPRDPGRLLPPALRRDRLNVRTYPAPPYPPVRPPEGTPRGRGPLRAAARMLGGGGGGAAGSWGGPPPAREPDGTPPGLGRPGPPAQECLGKSPRRNSRAASIRIWSGKGSSP